MALSEAELATIARLSLRHDSEIPELESLDRIYEGTEGLTYMHPEIFREVQGRIVPTVIHWAQLAIDSIVERLYVQGIKSGDEDLDKEFRRVWVANGMDLGLQQAMTDSLVMRRSYISIGTNGEDQQTPFVRPESPLELYVDTDPLTREPRAALRRYSDVDPLGSLSTRYATLYLPTETIWCQWVGGWKELARDTHNMGSVAVAPLVNRPRTRSATMSPRGTTVERIGRSDIDAVKSLGSDGNKLVTDMMVAAEFVAIPLRILFDVAPDEFKDEHGNPLTPLQAMMGRLVTIPNEGAKAFEFAAAQLANFTGAVRELSNLVSAVTGLPPHYMGTPSDNPASAEAITGSESRLATRTEQKHLYFEPGVRRAAQLVHRFQTGEWSDELKTCDIDWRNVRTPTVGAMADAAVKLYSTAPKPIVPLRQTREALGYSDSEIMAMEDEDEIEAERNPVAQLARMGSERPVGDLANVDGA